MWIEAQMLKALKTTALKDDENHSRYKFMFHKQGSKVDRRR